MNFVKMVIEPECHIPTRAHFSDAGLDLYARKGGWIWPKSSKVFGTGCHAQIEHGYVGFLTSKSGLMLKRITSRGTIDSDYVGEIKAVLFNHGWWFKRIKAGQKITQMVIMPIVTPKPVLVDSLEDTERGEKGFGSTGE